MRWQIEGYVFCDQQQSLTHQGKTQQLEPILVALLAYFCQQPDKIISRDELITAVWLGRTVTDSAVNRAITKLRRCFADDAKTPRFIATFPKKGYKFIAQAQPVTPAAAASPSGNNVQSAFNTQRQTSMTRFLYIAVTVIAVAIGLLWQQDRDTTASVLTTAKPLTRSAGQEWQPQLSPDQQYLMYTAITANNMQLFIKQLSDGQTIEVMPEAEAAAWVGPASWSPAGDKIVYLQATKEYCRYYLQAFDAMTLGQPQLIHNCPAGSYGKIAFTHNDKLLVYSERAAADAPYELFAFELASGKKRKLNQPPLYLAGNISFDLHPTQNILLVSSVDEQMWERFYSLDLATDALALLFKLDSYICCGIWGHSGTRVVLMGEHPAVQLISYDLRGKDRQVIYAGSQQLYEPERHPNGRDYIFAAGSSNLDVHFYRFNSHNKQPIVNTSVDDRLAVVSPGQDKVAYIGLATGTEEIWLADSDGKNQRRLSQFSDQRHFLDLTWSPDGKLLAALMLNEIHLFDISANVNRVLRIPQTEIRAISFQDRQNLFYSIKQDGNWRVKQYNLATNEVSATDSKWQYVRFDTDDTNTLWLDQQNNLYSGAAAKPVELALPDNHSIMAGRRFNLRKFGARWYWQHRDNDHYQLYSMAAAQPQPQPLLRSDSPHFDLSANGIFYHLAERRSTDIWQTQAPE